MSGLLRRIQRSRAADAGEPSPAGRDAAPGDAPAASPATGEPGEAAAARSSDPTRHQPVDPTTAQPVDAAATVPEATAATAAPAPPAGLDPGETRPVAGRRGRLRRRLRYLRRARELMLRDLGGLLYEVHRTGGGRVELYAGLIEAKVGRLRTLDSEAHALERTLAAPRGEDVIFEPGVGGTCAHCGELFSSAANFCPNCATPTRGRPVPDAAAAPAAPARLGRGPGGTVPAGPTAATPEEPHTPGANGRATADAPVASREARP